MGDDEFVFIIDSKCLIINEFANFLTYSVCFYLFYLMPWGFGGCGGDSGGSGGCGCGGGGGGDGGGGGVVVVAELVTSIVRVAVVIVAGAL